MQNYSSNMRVMNPQDANVMQPYGYGTNQWSGLGMNPDVMQGGQMNMQNQQPMPQAQLNYNDQIKAIQDQQQNDQAMKIMGQGIQNYASSMKQPMPSGNTAQIMRDQNQFRFAGTPQQQMAQALRRR